MEPFIGEIRTLAFNYIPGDQTWLACDGTIYNIRDYQALYSIIGNIYGGNLQKQTFAVPDLRSHAVIGPGLAVTGGTANRVLGQSYGAATATITTAASPSHVHLLQRKANTTGVNAYTQKTAAASKTSGLGVVQSSTNTVDTATTGASNTNLSANTITAGGGAASPLPHDNLQPYLVLTFAIAWSGVYPVAD